MEWPLVQAPLPRSCFLVAGAAMALAACVTVQFAVGAYRGPRITVSSMLSNGVRSGIGGGVMDRIVVPRDASEVRLTSLIPGLPDDQMFRVTVEAIDHRWSVIVGRPSIDQDVTGVMVTVALPVAALPRGDYLLRVFRAGGSPEPVATRAFRVVRAAPRRQ